MADQINLQPEGNGFELRRLTQAEFQGPAQSPP